MSEIRNSSGASEEGAPASGLVFDEANSHGAGGTTRPATCVENISISCFRFPYPLPITPYSGLPLIFPDPRSPTPIFPCPISSCARLTSTGSIMRSIRG